MELIICLALALSAFTLLITCIIGLVSAPTPILLGILVTGMLLTQKSINKFTEPGVNLINESEKDKIEKVAMASQSMENNHGDKVTKSMTYRGYNYNRFAHEQKTPHYKSSGVTHYRGAVIDNGKKEIV